MLTGPSFRVPAAEPAWQETAAWLLIVAGLVPLFESIWRFVAVGRGTLMPNVPTEHLVVSGLYRYVRNPMYVGDVAALVGEVLLFRSRALAIYTLLVWAGFDLFVRKYEERTLTRRHPLEYPRYQRQVPRWLPRLTPWTGDGN